MLRVRLEEARPGMVLAKAITHQTQPGLVLLRVGVSLNTLSIPRLRQIGVTHVWIEYPGLEELAKLWDPQLMEAGRDCVKQVARFVDAGLSHEGVRIDVDGCRAATTHLARSLKDASTAQALLSELESKEQTSVMRIASTTVLSLLLGLRLDYYLLSERSRLPASRAKDVTPLGLGAMLHDVGLLRAPDAIAAQMSCSSIEELEADARYHTHAIAGYQLLKGKVEPAVAAIVLHHHQHINGTGFPPCRPPQPKAASKPATKQPAKPKKLPPTSLVGKQIHVFARIVHVAQLVARLQYSELGTQTGVPIAQPAIKVLWRVLQAPFVQWCDVEVLRALLRVYPAFPLGSLVTLNDGRRAAVVAFHEHEPCTPTVEIVQLEGELARGQRIDLRVTPQLHITHVDGVYVEDCLHLDALLPAATRNAA
jgi:HD-GYP domain-containing protein (c-di-GMP phosphodiesterase class II)